MARAELRTRSTAMRAITAGTRLVATIPERFAVAIQNHRTAATILTVAMTAFTALAIVAITAEAALLRFDQPIQELLLESRTAWLNRAMVWLTFLGTRYVIGLAALALLAWSWITKQHRPFVLVMVAAALLNPIVEVGFKELVDRVRPAVDQLLPGNGPSFPSGHVLAAVGFYGLIPLFAWEVTRNAWVRFMALVGSLAIVAAVTVSRPYLDVHWTTDAIAGVYHVYLELPQRHRAPAVS